MKHFEYRSVEDLNQAIIKKLSVFPHDIDLIVGIPRSGMLPANLLALYLNKPYTDIDSFLEGRIYKGGARNQYFNQENINKVLIIDDYVATGKALDKAKERLRELEQKYYLQYGTVYVNAALIKSVDFYCEKLYNSLTVFQWNLFLYPLLIAQSCFDIDGVLCENPPIDDDGDAYLSYISNAVPLYLTTGEIDTIVTCRLEKYRYETETWLKKWDIRYKNLIMLNFPDKQSREEWGKYGDYKGEIYKKNNCILFVESSLAEAIDINKISGKPVFCTETFTLIVQYQPIRYRIGRSIKVLLSKIMIKLNIYHFVRKIYKKMYK